jgi:glycosyltransferase involved in cell wall biosynthesis
VSPQIAASVVAAGVPAERVDYMPNAVALPAASSPAHRGSDVRVGFLGRLCPDKDPVTALRALAVARSHSGPEVTVQLGGDGPMRGAVLREAERLHLTPYVRLAGTVFDVTAFMRHIDIFLLSSRSEGTPLAVLEAMGHGLPVVATGVGGVPLQVEDGVTGLIAPAGDHAALGRALAWIAEHPEEGLAMGRAGRRRLLRDFSLDTLVTQVEAVYTRSALARPEPAELAG